MDAECPSGMYCIQVSSYKTNTSPTSAGKESAWRPVDLQLGSLFKLGWHANSIQKYNLSQDFRHTSIICVGSHFYQFNLV